MATEELEVKVSVAGFADFEATFKKMAQQIDGIEQAYEELGGQSKKTGTALDGLGQAYDGNAARLNKLRLAMTQLDDVQAKLKTETNALARAQLEVKADALKKQIEDLSKVESDASQNTQKFKLSLTDLKSGIDMAVGAFKTVAAAAKEAFEFLQEGAQINAVAGRFEALAGGAQNAASILDAVGVATGHTIDKMSAMQSASKLMSMGLADNSKEVASLVRLAVKLGDQTKSTGDRINDFALMLANQSVERLDSFGIASGKVRQRIKELMDATSGLTREQAFLQATLEFGEESLDRLGDSVTSDADAYAVLTTTIKNLTDTMKASAAEGVSPLAQRFADFMVAAEGTDANLYSLGGNLQFLKALLTGTSDVQEKYNADLQENADATERARLYGKAWENQLAKNTTATQKTAAALDPAIAAFLEYEDALQGAVAPMRIFEEVTMASTTDVNNFKAALGGAVSNEMIAFRDREGELIQKGEELRAKISELEAKRYLTEAQKEQLAELRTQLGDNTTAVEENAAKHEEATKRILLGFIEQRLAIGGLSEDEQLALQEIANKWGLLDDATFGAVKAIDGYVRSVEGGKSTLDEMVERVDKLNKRLLETPTQIDIVYNIVTRGAIPNVGTGRPGEDVPYHQHGGTLGGGAFVVGERGPELITGWRGGGNVLSNPTAARMMSQNSITNNYNLTTNSTTRAGGLALEFATMEMGSR